MARVRTTTGRDRVITVTGAIVIAAALFGVLVVEGRGGPFTHDLEPVAFALAVSGTYHAAPPQGTTGPGGVCLPDDPAVGCVPARLEMDLGIQGLPGLGEGAHYVVSLQDGEDILTLGPLMLDDGVRSMSISQERDAREYERLVVTLEGQARPGRAMGTIVHEHAVSGGEPVDLTESVTVTPSDATGTAELNEIGAVGVSSTIGLRVEGLEPRDGWIHRAWFQEEDGSTTYIGELAGAEGAGPASLDERIERVRLRDQQAVLVTLEPAGTGTNEGSQGLPLLVALV